MIIAYVSISQVLIAIRVNEVKGKVPNKIWMENVTPVSMT